MNSIQNIQRLTGTGGCSKYVCKYIGKIDAQNYVVVECNREGKLVTKTHFLHNTKVSSSKINEDKICRSKRELNHPQGRSISQMEMLHSLLKYSEVFTDLNFISIPTILLEFGQVLILILLIKMNTTILHLIMAFMSDCIYPSGDSILPMNILL